MDDEKENPEKEKPKLDLVTATEAAEILGWKKQQVAEYIRHGNFPEPAAVLKPRGRVWHRKDIEQFRDDRERKKRRKERNEVQKED